MAKTKKAESKCPSAIERLVLGTIKFIILMIVLVLPLGAFSPFTAGEQMLAGGEIPSVGKTILWLIPLEAILLATIYLLNPRNIKKNEGDN